MGDVRLVIDGAAIALMLRGPDGPIARHLIDKATIVQAGAKARAPVKTGKLRDSIVKRFVEEFPTGLGIRVVATAKYAVYVHEGTKAHIIAAKDAKALAFFWANGPRGPGLYFFKQVNHPGTWPHPFLREALQFSIPQGAHL